MSNGLWRTRWAAIGAAMAVTLGAGGLFTASAALDTGERTVFVPITPCRIMDTRPGEPNTGPRATPIGADEIHTIDVRGTNGTCTIPADAVGVSLNVTALNGTSASYLTVFPADVAKPGSSSLNWQAGQAPTPNGVVADLAADGRLSFYNLAGTVDVIADVVGYYVDHNHDDRYYTEQEVDTALAGKVDSVSGTPGALVLGAASFVNDGEADATVTWFNSFSGGALRMTAGTACFAAPAVLPDGATVTAFDVWVADNAAGSLLSWLRVDPVGEPTAIEMAALNSGTQSPTVVQLTDTTISEPVVDNAANAYAVQVCLDQGVALHTARISYTNP